MAAPAGAEQPHIPTAGGGSVDALAAACDHSWLKQLSADPEANSRQPNRTSRQVRSGHFVTVEPLPLAAPKLVTFSADMAASLGLSEEAVRTDRFARLFSGDLSAAPDGTFASFATPYALAIYGQRMTDNCPFKNGNGYGDGRAISLGEVLVDGQRWEMQMKGAGPTPFCRGGDGRAVLRSSIREFLASEAMHHLHIGTTRALSCVVSAEEIVDRPWYSNRDTQPELSIDDPRLTRVPEQYRRQFLQQFLMQSRNPDIMVSNPAAITTRVSPSFLRVGHIDLFARRAKGLPADSLEQAELAAIVEHACFREFPGVCDDASRPLPERAVKLLEASADAICTLTANWVRVGFVQGNFNSDNCLVGGRTMDYGPFGWMERFEPLWNMWVGGGDHFGFLNQPVAGQKNWTILAESIAVMLKDHPTLIAKVQEMAEGYPARMQRKLDCVWAAKLGLASPPASEGAPDMSDAGTAVEASIRALVKPLLGLMQEQDCDWTIFWRQLASLAPRIIEGQSAGSTAVCDAGKLAVLAPAFSLAENEELRSTGWLEWLKTYEKALADHPAADGSPDAVAAVMKGASPKFVPREWMLVDAYTAAGRGDYSGVEELKMVFAHPYEELSEELSAKYYHRAEKRTASLGGTAFMS